VKKKTAEGGDPVHSIVKPTDGSAPRGETPTRKEVSDKATLRRRLRKWRKCVVRAEGGGGATKYRLVRCPRRALKGSNAEDREVSLNSTDRQGDGEEKIYRGVTSEPRAIGGPYSKAFKEKVMV